MISRRCQICIALLLFISLLVSTSYAGKLAEKGFEEKGRLVTMDFEGVEIRTLIKFIGELTGKNFVVDERVRGKATVISPTKLTVEEAYKVFESILEVHGYTIVPAGKVIKVIPAAEARGKSLTTTVGRGPLPEADSMITQVIPIRYADVNDVKALYTPLISKNSLLVAYQPTNTLIVTDFLSNINRLLKILKEVDIPGYELQLTVIPLHNASAKVVAQEIDSLFEAKRRAPRAARPPGQQVVEIAAQEALKLIPDERTNSLIILATAQTIKMIKEVIRTLDGEIPRGKGNIHIYYLQHAVAEDLAKVLSGVATEAKEGTAQTGPKAPAAKVPVLGEKVSIIADKPTNSLIIIASPQDYTVIEDVIKKLDIVRAQVYVEALIAEVTLDKIKELGVEWNLTQEAKEGKIRPYGGTDFGLIDAARSGALAGLIVGITRGFIPVGGVDVGDIKALVQLYGSDSDVNILSTPRLLTTDNEEAEIIVAEERPFLKSSQVTAEGSTVKTFEFKDVGITLKITPHISKGKLLRLNLFTEIKSFLEQIEGEVGAVVTTKRQASTSVIVEDGATVVIGGLIRDDKTDRVSKVPLLGDIPILGFFFKSRTQTKVKTNLLIFITPRIVTSAEELREIAEREKRDREKHIDQHHQEKEKIFPLFDEEKGDSLSERLDEKGTVEENSKATSEATGKKAEEIVPPSQGAEKGKVEKIVAPAEENHKKTIEELAPARNLIDISFDRSQNNTVIVKVQTDGKLDYSTFILEKPKRLVVDFWNIRRRFSSRSIPVDSPIIKKIRLGDYPEKVRVVLDITTETLPHYTIEPVGDQLRIALGDGMKAQPPAPKEKLVKDETILPPLEPERGEIKKEVGEEAKDDLWEKLYEYGWE
jgi:general secretion pathway protein D